MNFIRKIIRAYQYAYYRHSLRQKKNWEGEKHVSMLTSNYGLSCSTIGWFYVLDFFFLKFFDFVIFLHNIFTIVGISITVLIIMSLILKKDDEILNKKFSKEDESNLSWKMNGFFTILFIYGPYVLIIMFTFL